MTGTDYSEGAIDLAQSLATRAGFSSINFVVRSRSDHSFSLLLPVLVCSYFDRLRLSSYIIYLFFNLESSFLIGFPCAVKPLEVFLFSFILGVGIGGEEFISGLQP